MPAGYSGTPLATKLGVASGHAVALLGAPRGWTIEGLPGDVRVVRRRSALPSGPRARVVVLFTRTAEEVRRLAPAVAEGLAADASLWVAWPRRAGGHESDVTESLIRETLLPVGVVDVKVAAFDHDWSGLKFVWRKENRAGR